MITINMKNVTSKIDGVADYLRNYIVKKLSYTEKSFGKKPQTKTLYNNTKDITYTGLVPHILTICNQLNEKYIINDLRDKPNSTIKLKLQDNFLPRDYQQKIIDNSSSRDILQAATGAGKTFIMANLLIKHSVLPAIIVVPSISLAMQIKNEFEKFLGIPIGIVGGGFHEYKEITVGTPNSLNEQFLKECKIIFWDECLRYNQKILMEDGSYEMIGDIVKNKINKRVMSYNHNLKVIEPKQIIGTSKTKLSDNNKKLMKIKIKKQNGEFEIIECTDNHKIWVDNLQQYVYAKDLVKGQKVKTLSCHK